MQFYLRPAVAMIELIFAIVIMGIALMSAPMLISQANTSGYVATQQEAIATAASHMSYVLSRNWDEANAGQERPPSILTTTTDVAVKLNPVNGAGFRAGIFPSQENNNVFFTNSRSFFDADTANILAAGAIGEEAGEVNDNDDIDDFNGKVATLNDGAGAVAGDSDYIDRAMIMRTAVQYIDDAPNNADGRYNANTNNLTFSLLFQALAGPAVGATSNIKFVNVTLNQGAGAAAELRKQIQLSAFACNIGGYILEEIKP